MRHIASVRGRDPLFRHTIIVLALVGFACGDDDGVLDDAGLDASCAEGRADCDGDGMCEADLTQADTCGGCSIRCDVAETCQESMCVAMDAGADAGPTLCGVRWPDRPDIDDDAVRNSVMFALRDLEVDQREDRWREHGWSLDARCTAPSSVDHLCIPPGGSAPPIDGLAGRDNTFGEMVLNEISRIDATFQASVNARMLAGETSILQINDWNGGDDPVVDVYMAEAVSVRRADGATEPQWDGDDVWDVSQDAFVLSDVPRIRDDRAYIVGGTLVARFPDREPIRFPFFDGSSIELNMTDVILVGTFSDDGRRLEDVTITGRFSTLDLEPALENAGICAGSELRSSIETALNGSLDIRSTPGTGGTGAVCDAVSVAFPMVGVQANFGAIEPALVVPLPVCP